MAKTEESKPLHVAMVLSPGIGHLIPLTEFAKRLVINHPKFEVTIFIPNDGSPMKYPKQLLQALPKSISTIFLPPVSFDDLPHNVDVETKIVLSLVRSVPALKHSLKVLLESTRLVAVVVDLFGIEPVSDICKELGIIMPYIFFPTSAMMLQLLFHMPKFDQTFSCESFSDLVEPLELPGCVPLHGRDVPDPLRDKNCMAYEGTVQLGRCYSMAAGIMVNSFVELQQSAFKALMMNQGQIPAVYPVGPLVQTGSSNGGVNESNNCCLKWLNEQPDGSVVYVSFGSGGTLSNRQMNELAMGLEMSGQRFLWVVKSPNDKAKNATFFSVESVDDDDPVHFLPNGFLERTKGVGLVVPSWAPQVEVLSHGSTGGFVTHCGWNSILEAIVHGVPLIAWPLYAEQRMNAVILADDLKVAWRVKENENGLVGREEIAKFVKGLIQGEEGKPLRDKMRKLKEAAKMALSPDGSSTKSLAKVAEIWNDHGK